MHRLALASALCLLLPACDDDPEPSDETGTTSAASTTTGGAGAEGSTTMSAGSTTSTNGNGTDGTSSGGAAESSTSGAQGTGTGAADGSTGNPSTCDPQIPGEFNACVGEDGDIDNTLCNWTGIGGATGYVGCLTSSGTEGANVCMISGCRDVCDCFAQPETGTAQVECREVLEGGGTACILNCADGESCPDGMSCEGGLCFHLPPG